MSPKWGRKMGNDLRRGKTTEFVKTKSLYNIATLILIHFVHSTFSLRLLLNRESLRKLPKAALSQVSMPVVFEV